MSEHQSASQLIAEFGVTDDSTYKAWRFPWRNMILLLDTWQLDNGTWVATLLDITLPEMTHKAESVPSYADGRGATKTDAARQAIEEFLQLEARSL